MSSDNFKDLTPDDNYASVELTGDSIVLPPDAEDVILVVEGDSSISGTVNVELEHSNDNVNFTTAKNKPLTTGAGGEPAAPTIEAYFSRIPNPRIVPSRLAFTAQGQSPISSVYLGELILNAMDASNPNGTYTIEIVGPDAQYVEFRATNENARASYLDHFENENLDTADAAFINVQDPLPNDGTLQMSVESVNDHTSPQPYLAFSSGNSSENKFNSSLKLRDSSHQMQQGHVITGINYKNKVELHTRADDGDYTPSFNWIRNSSQMQWANNSYFMNADRAINISIIITPEFGANPQPVTIFLPYFIRGVPSVNSSASALPHTASIGDSFGNINIQYFSNPYSFPALDYEITCHDSRIALSGTTAQSGGTLTATLNTSNFSPFGGLSITTSISAKEPTKGLTSFDDTAGNLTFTVNANPLSVTAGTVTSPANNAALGTDVCSVSVAGGLGTESITLSVAGTDASYYRLNNVTAGTTGSTITATSTDTVVLETNQAFSFSGYSHSVDIEASFTDSYGTYTDSVTGISISQAGYTLTSNVSSVDEGNTFTIDLNTLGTTAGDTVAYTITGVDSADINGASLTGNFTLSGNLDDAITFTATADTTTEGAETFTLSLDNGESSVSVTINDTSTSAPATFSNEYYVSDAYRGVITNSKLTGNYNRDSSSDNLGFFPDLDSTTNFRSSPNVSYSFWFKPNSSGSTKRNLIFAEIYENASGNQDFFQMYTSKSPEELQATSAKDGTTRYHRIAQVNNDAWYHVVVTTNTDDVLGGATYYINGVAVTSLISSSGSTITRSDPVEYIVFGGESLKAGATQGTADAGGTSGNFEIDEFSTWKKTLSASEVTELYNNGVPTDLTNHSAFTDLQRWLRWGDTTGDGTAIKDSQNTSWEVTSFDSQDNTQDASSETIYVAPPAAAFSNTSAVSFVPNSFGDRTYAYRNDTDHPLGGYGNTKSISLWFYVPTMVGSLQYSQIFSLIGQDGSGNFVNYSLQLYGLSTNTILYQRWVGESSSDYDPLFSTIAQGQWHHLVITFEDYQGTHTLTRAYLNNGTAVADYITNANLRMVVPEATGAVHKGMAIGGKWYITAGQTYGTETHYSSVNYETDNILVDEFSTWNKTLTAAEVSDIYNSGVPNDLTQHSASSDLVRWFRFGDGANDTSTSIEDTQNAGVTLDSTTDYRTTLTSSDSIYVAPPASGYSNTKAIESPATWTLSGGDVNGATMPTGRIGTYQNIDPTKHLFGGANSNANISVSLWYNQAATPNGGHMLLQSVLIDNSNTTGSVKWGLMQYTNDRFYITRAGVSYDANTYGSALLDNVWRHVVITVESTSATTFTERVYIDGSFAGYAVNLSKSHVPYLFDMTGYTNYGFAVGGAFDTDANHSPYQGYQAVNSNNMRVDEISTFNKQLSASEITAIYNSGVPTDLTGHDGLVHWFRMGDGSTDTGTSIVSQTDSSVSITSSTDYSLTLTSSDTIKTP